jgi:uncharacterized protein YjeT (DUF2065 family)
MWDVLVAAFGLMLVIEGLLPFFSPGSWRKVFEGVMKLSDGQIRFVGLACMVGGLLLLLLFAP